MGVYIVLLRVKVFFLHFQMSYLPIIDFSQAKRCPPNMLRPLVALWPAILRFAAALAALILRLQPAGCDFGSSKHHRYRGGLGLRFSNRGGLRPIAI